MKVTESNGVSESTYEQWDYEDEEKRQREEQARLEAEQKALKEELPTSEATSVPEGAQGPTITPGDVARTSEKEQLNDGIVTKIGEAIGYTLKADGLTADVLNAGAAGLNQLSGGNLQGLDDAVLGSEETQAQEEEIYAQKAERRAAGEMSGPEQVVDTTLNAVTGVTEGFEGGLAMLSGLSLAARVANQNAPWSDPPEILKNSPVGASVMKITEILVPTLLTGGIAGGSAATLGTRGLIAESALETIPQRSSDDLILGNQVASSFGDIANNLGLDGNQLTKDMVEGVKPNAQVLNAAVGFVQNLGINLSVNTVLDYFFKGKPAKNTGLPKLEGSTTPNRPGLPPERFDRGRALPRKGQPRLPGQKGLPEGIEEVVVEIIDEPTIKAAKAMGKSPEDVAKAVNDVQTPPYRPDAEPSDVFEVDNFTSTANPSKGNTYGSSEAMMREIIRGSDEIKRTGSAVGQDGFTDANRSYFMNWKAITQDESLQTALEELTKNFRLLDSGGNEAIQLMIRAKKFWQANKGLLEDGPEGFAKAMYDFGAVSPMDGRKGMNDLKGLDWKRAMREEMGVTEEGFTVMALAGEQLGVQVSKMGRMLNQLDFGGIDFTKAMEVYVNYAEKVDLILVPLRRAKRKWSIDGFAQQNRIQRQIAKIGKSNIVTALKDYAANPKGSLEDFTKIGFDDADPGMTLREMWERYKAGDEEAGKLLKAYVDFMGNIPPSGTLQQMRMMNQILDRYLKQGGKEATRSIFFASMLFTTEPIKAAFTGGLLQVLSQPIGNMVRGKAGQILNKIPGIFSKTGDIESKRTLMYGLGQWQGLMTNVNASIEVLGRSFKNNELIHTTQRIEGLTAKARVQKELELKFAHNNIMDRLTRENATDWQKLQAQVFYNYQLAGLSPKLQLPNRLLTAIDQAAITAVGNSEAMAQGMVKAFDDGVTDPKSIQDYIKFSTESVFEDGIKTGRVRRGDVLEAAKQITFQADIPMGDAVYNLPKSNLAQKAGGLVESLADGTFKQVELASKNSAVLGYFNPFVRVNYGFLDKVAQMEPTGYLASLIPRYRAIIAGQMGPSKQMQLKSGIAFTRLQLMAFGGMALSGGIIGKITPAGMEEFQDHFIIPNPFSAQGFTAVPFGRLQPYAQYLSAQSDVINSFKRNVINTTQYDRLIKELIMSMGMNTLDSSFQQGQQKMARLLDLTNVTTAVPQLAAELTALPFSFARQPLGMFSPYETMQGDKVDGLANFLSRVSQRATGGIGNPIQYNRYTGQPILKSGREGGSYWEGVGNNLINILGYPGLIKDAGAETPVFKEMESVAYDTNKYNNNNRVGTGQFRTQLTTKELSALDQLTGDPKIGALQRRLSELFDSNAYKNLKKEYQSRRKEINPAGNLLSVESEQKSILGGVHRMIDAVHNKARQVALDAMVQSGDYPQLQLRQKMTNVDGLLKLPTR